MPSRHPDSPSLLLTWARAGVSAAVGLVLVPIAVNVLAYPLFSWHESYHVAWGLGYSILFLSIYAAPLGGIFWICWGVIAATSAEGGNFAAAWLWFAGFLVALTLCIGGILY
ncbi:hypothetical protein [Tautonia rosea]|uniref:hypothetical protein n=1 Tax=Tautonia rosea TaxID=2728037 RepID=UPI001472AB1F|nr:hypothetical protein [Tautonia rosea]